MQQQQQQHGELLYDTNKPIKLCHLASAGRRASIGGGESVHGGICSPTHMVSATWRLSGCVELILRFAERSFVLRRKEEKQLLVRGVLMMCCFSITVYRCSIFAAATCSYQAHKNYATSSNEAYV